MKPYVIFGKDSHCPHQCFPSLATCLSQTHRPAEFGRHFWSSFSPAHCSSRATQSRLPRIRSRWLLKIFKDLSSIFFSNKQDRASSGPTEEDTFGWSNREMLQGSLWYVVAGKETSEHMALTQQHIPIYKHRVTCSATGKAGHCQRVRPKELFQNVRWHVRIGALHFQCVRSRSD